VALSASYGRQRAAVRPIASRDCADALLWRHDTGGRRRMGKVGEATALPIRSSHAQQTTVTLRCADCTFATLLRVASPCSTHQQLPVRSTNNASFISDYFHDHTQRPFRRTPPVIWYLRGWVFVFSAIFNAHVLFVGTNHDINRHRVYTEQSNCYARYAALTWGRTYCCCLSVCPSVCPSSLGHVPK